MLNPNVCHVHAPKSRYIFDATIFFRKWSFLTDFTVQNTSRYPVNGFKFIAHHFFFRWNQLGWSRFSKTLFQLGFDFHQSFYFIENADDMDIFALFGNWFGFSLVKLAAPSPQSSIYWEIQYFSLENRPIYHHLSRVYVFCLLKTEKPRVKNCDLSNFVCFFFARRSFLSRYRCKKLERHIIAHNKQTNKQKNALANSNDNDRRRKLNTHTDIVVRVFLFVVAVSVRLRADQYWFIHFASIDLHTSDKRRIGGTPQHIR